MKGARYYAGIVLSILLGIIAGSAAAGWAIRVFKYTSGMCSLALLGGCSLPPEEVPEHVRYSCSEALREAVSECRWSMYPRGCEVTAQAEFDECMIRKHGSRARALPPPEAAE